MKGSLLLVALFVFISACLSSSAYAFLPIQINQTVSLANNVRGIRCINSTADDMIYCYVQADSIIYRFNESLGNQTSCAMNYTGNPQYGISVANYSLAFVSAGTSYCDGWDITNIANGTCVLISRTSNANSCKSKLAMLQIGDFFNNDIFYVPNYNIVNLSWLNVQSPYWHQPTAPEQYPTTIMLSDNSDNSTLYQYHSGTAYGYGAQFKKYVNGVLTNTFDNFSVTHGITAVNHIDIDIFRKDASTTYAFIVADNGALADSIYRVNFSLVEANDSFFTCSPHWFCENSTEYFMTSECNLTLIGDCGACGCSAEGVGGRCNSLVDGWVCHSQYENWHYTDCVNDQQVICDIGCSGGVCVGETLCVNDSDCSNYCDGSMLFYNPYCDLSVFNCKWSSYQDCPYLCSLGACVAEPPIAPMNFSSPSSVIGDIKNGVFGFLSGFGSPFFFFIFIIVVVILVISVFSVIAYLIRKGVH